MYKKFPGPGFFIFLTGALVPLIAGATPLFAEGAAKVEELRMRQLQSVQSQADIAPFATDGCSGNLSAGWERLANTLPGFGAEFGDRPPWEHCCVEHDKTYWGGAVSDGYTRRIDADRQLKHCVVATGDKLAPELSARHPVSDSQVRQTFSIIAELMYKAVRLGGQPCSLLPWRWGYGWPNCAFAMVSDTDSEYSDIKTDEHVVFFDTSAWLDAEQKYWHIPVHAWIYEPADSVARKAAFTALLESAYELTVTSDTQEIFSQRTNLLMADNERGKVLVIRIADHEFALPASTANGHIYTLLKIPAESLDAISDQGLVRYYAVTRPNEKRRFEGNVQLISSRGTSVISDIDDTIKITDVTDHRKLFANTFFNEFREVPRMSELYQQLAASGAKLHFVSSSPWQLYNPLKSFIDRVGFPRASLSLKALRFRDETLFNLFKKGTETKPEQIEPILQRYPHRQFILIGDNGEQDPEVYGDIARHYPEQIRHVLIRNIDASTAGDQRYKAAFRNVARKKWQLFVDPREIFAAHLLSVTGYIEKTRESRQ